MKTTIGLADDQQLFLKSLASLINSFPTCEVVLDALNGEDLLKKLALRDTMPDILLIDVEMPLMDGSETVKQVTAKYPLIRLVALSMKDDDATIIQMIMAGCCAYLLKDIHPTELERALQEVMTKGYYNADSCNINYRRLLTQARKNSEPSITPNEMKFLQLACSDMTYKQVASLMNLSERTIDGYRESLFEKLNVQSRVGMVLEGIRRKIIKLS
ncbi:response regulator transcription factor [Puia dinghuensis]|nr:response regulator transcription factor [Puia dinghuensis]